MIETALKVASKSSGLYYLVVLNRPLIDKNFVFALQRYCKNSKEMQNAMLINDIFSPFAMVGEAELLFFHWLRSKCIDHSFHLLFPFLVHEVDFHLC